MVRARSISSSSRVVSLGPGESSGQERRTSRRFEVIGQQWQEGGRAESPRQPRTVFHILTCAGRLRASGHSVRSGPVLTALHRPGGRTPALHHQGSPQRTSKHTHTLACVTVLCATPYPLPPTTSSSSLHLFCWMKLWYSVLGLMAVKAEDISPWICTTSWCKRLEISKYSNRTSLLVQRLQKIRGISSSSLCLTFTPH